MADMALAWLLAQPAVASVIVGARDADQARRNVHAADLALPPDTVRELSRATVAVKQALGPNIDPWQGGTRTR
jgi:aryl-alcohol dehydrogenase-like predicted oxidoreductase